MKIINMMLLLAGVALLAGCASLAEPQNRPDEQWNSAYIQAVEQAARNEPRGMDVMEAVKVHGVDGVVVEREHRSHPAQQGVLYERQDVLLNCHHCLRYYCQ